MARIGTNMSVQVESTKAAALTISGITKANPGVATITSSPITVVVGDVVVFTATAGMVELDGQAVRVATISGDTFELEGLDTTDYSTWTAGTCAIVDAWHTIAGAQTISMPDPAPNKIDITTLIDKTKQNAYGLPEAPDGTITGLYDPSAAGVVEIKTATKANETRAFRVNWAGGQFTIFNANVSGGSGFELAQNDVAKATINYTPVKDILDYAS